MNSSSLSLLNKVAIRTAVAVAAVAACSAASALPAFTFNPGAVGLAGSTYTADNLLVADYTTVTATATGFTETGFLQITAAQLGSTVLASNPGLYISFSATGSNVVPAGSAFQFGNLTNLTYTLYGYTGASAFSPTSAPVPSVTLGSGSLVSGTFNDTLMGTTVTGASATATLTFNAAAAARSFFVSPTTFYGLAQTAISNTSQQITTTATGFSVSQGGGSVNFLAAPVPEPETYALMLAGLAAVGFVARRRNNG